MEEKGICWGCGKEGRVAYTEQLLRYEDLLKRDRNLIDKEWVSKPIGSKLICTECQLKLAEQTLKQMDVNEQIRKDIRMKLFGEISAELTKEQEEKMRAYIKKHKPPFVTFPEVETEIGELSSYYKVLPALKSLFRTHKEGRPPESGNPSPGEKEVRDVSRYRKAKKGNKTAC